MEAGRGAGVRFDLAVRSFHGAVCRSGRSCLETSTLLAALAQETSQAKIGVLVYGNPSPPLGTGQGDRDGRSRQQRPRDSGHRGWVERARALRAYRFPFPSAGDRVMLDEALQRIMESLFSNVRTTFHGAHYDLADAPFAPKPVPGRNFQC